MTYNIPPHHRGDTWDGINSITIKVNGVPLNLTGSTVKMEFRQGPDYPVVLKFSTEDNTIQIANNTAIRVMGRKIEIPFGLYYYDLEVTLPDGRVKTFMSGNWRIVADITE